MKENPEINSRESEIKKRATSDAMKYLNLTSDKKTLDLVLAGHIIEESFKELNITSQKEREFYIKTLAASAGIKTR